jgi:hypothetical protein
MNYDSLAIIIGQLLSIGVLLLVVSRFVGGKKGRGGWRRKRKA